MERLNREGQSLCELRAVEGGQALQPRPPLLGSGEGQRTIQTTQPNSLRFLGLDWALLPVNSMVSWPRSNPIAFRIAGRRSPALTLTRIDRMPAALPPRAQFPQVPLGNVPLAPGRQSWRHRVSFRGPRLLLFRSCFCFPPFRLLFPLASFLT